MAVPAAPIRNCLRSSPLQPLIALFLRKEGHRFSPSHWINVYPRALAKVQLRYWRQLSLPGSALPHTAARCFPEGAHAETTSISSSDNGSHCMKAISFSYTPSTLNARFCVLDL